MSDAGHDATTERIEREAAAWVLARDRGLTPAEQDGFSEWLAADPRHGAQLARQQRHWQRLDALAEWRPEHSARPNPDLLAPPLRRRVVRFVPAFAALAAAAAVALTWMLWDRAAIPVQPAAVAAAGTAKSAAAPNQRVLEDGTIVELNHGAELSVHYTAAERRVTLEKGEAHFAVNKNPARPFVVRARGVDVRAVGTAFNVRLDAAAVEVLVTEGSVQLETKRATPVSPTKEAVAPGATEANEMASGKPAILEARQRAVIAIPAEAAQPAEPEIATLTAGEIERVLAWQHRTLDFTEVPLNQVVAELNRKNVVQFVVIDPELAALRITATLRSDSIDGFVWQLENAFGVRVEKRGETEILLRKAK